MKDTKSYGTISYADPDLSTPAEDRAFYSFPINKCVKHVKHELHDFRTSQDIVKDPSGLDVQGFTFVTHESALSGAQWFEDHKVEEVYVPEVIELICTLTGATRAVVDGVAFRRKAVQTVENSSDEAEQKRGSAFDVKIGNLRRDVIRVPGRDISTSAEPARICHVDYSVKGLRDTARWCRKDIRDTAKSVIDAEDEGQAPRYAAYGVWRPLETVKRDPLAALDWRTLDKSELVHIQTRALSGVKEDGEYIRDGLSLVPPKVPDAQRWYWMPEQKPDDVLVLKFADTAPECSDSVAAHCVHGSPEMSVSGSEPRQSIECRVLAFWH